jgi:glutaminase
MDLPSIAEQAQRPYVSTGHLPEAETVQQLVSDAHRRSKSNTDGQNSQVYPALTRVPSDLFGACVVGASGNVYAAGNTDHEFSITSVSRPFVFAMVCETIGLEEQRASRLRLQILAPSRGLSSAHLVGSILRRIA